MGHWRLFCLVETLTFRRVTEITVDYETLISSSLVVILPCVYGLSSLPPSGKLWFIFPQWAVLPHFLWIHGRHSSSSLNSHILYSCILQITSAAIFRICNPLPLHSLDYKIFKGKNHTPPFFIPPILPLSQRQVSSTYSGGKGWKKGSTSVWISWHFTSSRLLFNLDLPQCVQVT